MADLDESREALFRKQTHAQHEVDAARFEAERAIIGDPRTVEGQGRLEKHGATFCARTLVWSIRQLEGGRDSTPDMVALATRCFHYLLSGVPGLPPEAPARQIERLVARSYWHSAQEGTATLEDFRQDLWIAIMNDVRSGRADVETHFYLRVLNHMHTLRRNLHKAALRRGLTIGTKTTAGERERNENRQRPEWFPAQHDTAAHPRGIEDDVVARRIDQALGSAIDELPEPLRETFLLNDAGHPKSGSQRDLPSIEDLTGVTRQAIDKRVKTAWRLILNHPSIQELLQDFELDEETIQTWRTRKGGDR